MKLVSRISQIGFVSEITECPTAGTAERMFRLRPRRTSTPVAPLTATESPSVRAAVQAGELPWSVAQERLIAAIKNGRHWGSAEWRALGERLIKDHCEQCGTREGPFTLQHFWQPAPIPKIASRLRADHGARLWDEFQARYPVAEATEERQACPRCKSGARFTAGRRRVRRDRRRR